MYRYGSSSVVGLVAKRGVRLRAAGCRPGSVPKLCAGAPGSPQNTWFHTPLVQLPMVVLRTRYCCWEPFSTVPLSLESAMNPPLDQPGDPPQ